MFLELDKKTKEKAAVIDVKGNSVTYGELIECGKNLENYINRRTVVFILAQNNVETLKMYIACMINKIVPLLIDARTNVSLLQRLIDLYHPSYIWGNKERLKQLEYLQYVDCIDENCGLVETFLSEYELFEELSLLLTTSGSTGSPKLVRHSYQNIERQAENISLFFELDGSERPMVDLPIMYTYGLSIVNSHLFVGATVLVTDESIVSKRFWQFFKEEGATSFTGVPYSYELLKQIRFFKMDLPSLRVLSQGGGKMPKELQKEFVEYIQSKNGKYYATYGQTEGSARMAYLPPELALKKCGSIGMAIPNGKLYLKDEQDNLIVIPNVEGELYYEGPNVTLGYAVCGEDLKKGDERFGVLATGDVAYMDEDECFYIVGRKKRFLKLFGYRVSLDECEILIQTEFMVECACIGNDQQMIVCITDKEKIEAVKTFLLKKTSLYPTAVKVVAVDKILRNPAGKILYNELERYVGIEK